MRNSFSDIKKLLPGIILGLVFVGAFSFGLYGVNNPSFSTLNPPPTQNRDLPTPANIIEPNPPQMAIPEQPGLVPEPAAPVVVAEPEVAVEATPVLQPILSGEEHEKGEKKEKEKERKEGGKEHHNRKDDDN